MDWKRLIVSFSVAAFVSFVILLLLNDFGITWDEPIHIRDADQYVAWLKRPIWGDKDKFFAVTFDDVHPPFRKLVAGLTHQVFTNDLKVIDNTRGYRISALFFVFSFIILFTYIAIGQFGYVIGVLAPLIFSFLPHVLYLTPLLTMDYAIAVLWFTAVVTFVKGIKQYFWLTISGISIGLTMLTKLHGYLLFVPVIGYWVWHFRGHYTRAAWVRVIFAVAVAWAVYIIGWPWLWNGTLAHLVEYFRVQTGHGSVPEYIFGKTYEFAPWWYTAIMFLTTTPAFVLIFGGIGSYWTVRKGKTWDWIILLNALYPILFFSLPGIYRYDWVRQFLAAFPFVTLLAGRGIQVTVKSFKKDLRAVVSIIIIAAWIATLYFSVIIIHPWESAYYNEFVGGIKGANRIGMESEFWGNAYLGALSWMNENKIHRMCVTPTTYPFYYYQAMGQIQSGVTFTAPRDVCDYVVVLMRQGLFVRDPYIAKVVHTQKPVYTVSVDGVTLVGVYDIREIKD